MKKIIYACVVLLAFCWQSNAQFTFSPIAGPTNVAAGAPVTLDLNDAANTAGVTAGQYATFTITVDWVAGTGNPWSTEAEMQVTTSAGVADVDPPTAGGASNGNATTLTFAAGLAGIYDPSVDGSLSITLGQSFGGSDADWSNISVTLNPFVPPTPPVTAATLNISGCSASDSYMTAYDASVAGIVWVEVIYDGNCSALIADTETSSFDTEIGVYNSSGFLIGSDDDGGTGALSIFTAPGLAAGTYYVAAGAYNTAFGAGFAVTTSATSTTGSLSINVSTPAPPPTCVAPTIDSTTVVDSCNPDGTGTFNVEVVVSDAGDAGTVISDGTDTYPVVVGTVVAGPYNSGDTVTLSVDTVDDACDTTLGDFTFTCPLPAPDNDDCAGALPLECGVTVTGTTEGATASGLDAECNGFTSSGAQDLFYTFEADGTSSYTLSLDDASGGFTFDGVMFVYAGPCVDL
ncbi:MAG: hypothetical protein KDD26_06390, partial [Winogradskyella sp.]|nr:hypothetical protein [Winogradskyella sp.]